MDICNQLCLSCWLPGLPTIVHLSHFHLSFLPGKNFNVGHYNHTFEPNSFTPVMLIGTINHYHVIPLWVILILAEEGHKTCWRLFLTHFPTDKDEIWRGITEIQVKYPEIIFECALLNQEGNAAVILKKFINWHAIRHLQTDLVQTWSCDRKY